jgi:Ca-activated chloride channel family protein
MGTHEVETISHRPRRDLHHWLLAAILLPLLLYHAFMLAVLFRREAGSLRAADLAGAALAAGAGLVAALLLWRFAPGDFHFMRPGWLVTLAPLLLILWWIVRKQDETRAWRGIIEDHLLQHLLLAGSTRHRVQPWHLLAVVCGLTVIALAGPTWRREPSPFAEDQAALFMVVKVTPSMNAKDIQPSRLERAKHKVKDLLALRKGARAGLIAYSGSAHLVMPLTRDGGIIASFAGELDPRIMPVEGDVAAEAVAMASERLERAGLLGSILLVADGISAEQAALLKENRASRIPVHVLAVTKEEGGDLSETASALDGTFTSVTPDGNDVDRIAARCERALAAAVELEGGERWRDFGYFLISVIALLSLVWFRPGWLVAYS